MTINAIFLARLTFWDIDRCNKETFVDELNEKRVPSDELRIYLTYLLNGASRRETKRTPHPYQWHSFYEVVTYGKEYHARSRSRTHPPLLPFPSKNVFSPRCPPISIRGDEFAKFVVRKKKRSLIILSDKGIFLVNKYFHEIWFFLLSKREGKMHYAFPGGV